MPLPMPHKNEDKNTFVSRCMRELGDKKEGKDNKQRVAMCMSQWSRKDKSSQSNKSILDRIIECRKEDNRNK